MNEHDSEKIGGLLSDLGYKESDDAKDADVIIINTCSIREKAEQKFFSELGRMRGIKKRNPGLRIVVAGCIAQQRGRELFKRFPYIDFVVGPDNINKLQDWATQTSPSIMTSALDENPEYPLMNNLPIKRVGRVKAWVSIMYGCDNFCSYCVVPHTRGRERSRPWRDIYNEVKGLADTGYKEVTLLGQNVNSYGKNLDKNIDFPDLLKVIHKINGLERIRFITSHPKDLSDKLIEYMRDLPKVCEHIHLPLQAGSNRVLKLMNRGYTYEQFRERVYKLKTMIPDIAITTDIIVGFPGEEEVDFRDTIKALQEIEFDGIFAFKYSKRPATVAINLPDHVDEETKSRRLREVLMLQEDITSRKNMALEGRIVEVLVEGCSPSHRGMMTGRTRSNKIVNYYGSEKDMGRLVKVKIQEGKQHSLYGERVEDSNPDTGM